MTRFRPGLFLLILICAVLSITACGPEPVPPGVVALVNGKPITLRMIEARHDADGAFAAVSQSPSVELLREQYGNILAELIVQELVAQELERLGLAVEQDDVEDAVRRVQDDYPEGWFAQTLFDANIDEQAWADLMRYTVVMLRFNSQVLRPQISLGSDEVEKYYLEHAAEFLVPAHCELRVLSSASRPALETALERLKDGKSLLDLAEVHTQTLEMRPSLFPDFWVEELSRLKPGEASDVRDLNGLFQAVIMEKRSPARRMSPVEAYPRIEQVLLDWKMKTLFAEWLDAATAEADIQTTPLLFGHEPVPSVQSDADLFRDTEPIADDDNGEAALAPDDHEDAAQPEPTEE